MNKQTETNQESERPAAESLDYTYSAPAEAERGEPESVKRRYTEQKGDSGKADKLCATDKKIGRIPLTVGVCLGILGALILGVGMTTVLEWNGAVLGTVICIAGIAVFAAAFPVYGYLLARNKRRYGGQTVEPSDENGNDGVNRPEQRKDE